MAVLRQGCKKVGQSSERDHAGKSWPVTNVAVRHPMDHASRRGLNGTKEPSVSVFGSFGHSPFIHQYCFSCDVSRQRPVTRFYESPRTELFNHHYQYDLVLLRGLLESAGFREVLRCLYQQGWTPDLLSLDRMSKKVAVRRSPAAGSLTIWPTKKGDSLCSRHPRTARSSSFQDAPGWTDTQNV
jgi:hypothetical protein